MASEILETIWGSTALLDQEAEALEKLLFQSHVQFINNGHYYFITLGFLIGNTYDHVLVSLCNFVFPPLCLWDKISNLQGYSYNLYTFSFLNLVLKNFSPAEGLNVAPWTFAYLPHAL